MMRSRLSAWFMLCTCCVLTVTVWCDEARVGWMIYPYKLTMPEDQYQRLLQYPEVEYVGIQLFASPTFRDELTRKRVAQLAQAGKKVILQIWFGPRAPLSWERYNFPNIALDPKIREEFFAKATDPMIGYLGSKNLYAVHLLEETGMQFAWDVDMPARPYRDDDGYDNGNPYDNPPNWVMDRCISGPNVLSIRRYNDLFRKETGLDMRLYPIWTGEEMQQYRHWVQQRMEAGAHNEFANHVHRKYPGLRVYAFNSGPALIPQSKVLDGQFIDPYTHTLGVYMHLRGFRTVMRADQELVGMTWGNRDEPMHLRLPQQAACYMAGCNVLSTFGDNETQEDQWMHVVRDSVKPFLRRPVFHTNPRMLVLNGGPVGTATLRGPDFWITGFANYDLCEPWAQAVVNLNKYDIVFAWNAWHKDLLPWIRNGGILVGVHIPGKPLIDEGYLGAPGKPERSTLEYYPDSWMRENLRLQQSYKLELEFVSDFPVEKPDVVHKDQFIYVIPCGKGLIVMTPALCYVHPPWQYESFWEPYRQLLTDLCRGALILKGKHQIADEYFDDPQLGNDYLKATSADGRTSVYLLLIDAHGQEGSRTSFVVPGKDLVSGRENARLCQEHPVIIIERGG